MSLLAELKRRNVFRVAVAYLVIAWVLMQVADVLFPALRLPEWSITLVAVLLAIGFVPTLAGAWIFELTPEGIRRESQVDRSASITRDTGRKLNLITIAMVVFGIVLLAADRYFPGTGDAGPERPAADDGIPVIAILPFKATGSDDGGVLASGLHDDLLTKLHKIGAFRVLSRTSVMEYADSTRNMREIGEELGAGYILEGSVQALGDRVRINAQLIDAPDDEHLWADIYDRRLTASDLFDIQAELATAIAEQLHRTLSPSDRAIVDAVPTQNTEAYEAYLHALQVQVQLGNNSTTMRRAVELLEKAVRLDPEFATAWARLSQARTRLARLEDDPKLREAALTALAEARALKRDLIEAEIAWSVYLYHGQFEYEQALEALEALGPRGEANPDVLQLKTWLYRRLGRFDDAYQTSFELLQRDRRYALADGTIINLAVLTDRCAAAADYAEAALRIAGDSPDVRAHVAEFELNCNGDAARATELLQNMTYLSNWHLWIARTAATMEGNAERMLQLADTPFPEPTTLGDYYELEFKAYVYRQLGMDSELDEQLARMDEYLAGVADDEAIVATAAYAQAKALRAVYAGDKPETRAWIERHRQRSVEELKGDVYWISNDPWAYASMYAEVGLYDDAVRELRQMLEGPGGLRFPWIDATPSLDVLKDHPGYIELRNRFGD